MALQDFACPDCQQRRCDQCKPVHYVCECSRSGCVQRLEFDRLLERADEAMKRDKGTR